MDPILNRAYQQILQLFSANMIKALFGFLGTLLVLRGWNTADIGDIYTLVGVMLLFQQLGDLGTGSSFIQLYTRSRKENLAVVESYLSFKIIVVSILASFLAGLLLYYYAVNPSREILGLIVITVGAIFGIFGGFFTGLTTARQQFVQLSFFKIVPPLLKTLLICFFFLSGRTHFNWLLLAFITPGVTLFMMGRFMTGFSLTQHAKIKPVFSKRGLQLYHMSKWVFLIGFAHTAFSQIDIFMLKRLSSDFEIAQFVGAFKLAAVVFMLSQAVFTVMLPKMRSYKTNAELIRLCKQLFLAYLGFTALMIPMTFLAPVVVPWLFGPRYVAAVPILKVFLFQAIGFMFISSQSLVFYRKNTLHWLVVFSYVQLALNFVGNYLVIPHYRALGAVIVSAVLNNVFYIVALLFSLYVLKSKNQDSTSK